MLFLGLTPDENVILNVIKKESWYSPKTVFMRSIKAAGSFVRPKT